MEMAAQIVGGVVAGFGALLVIVSVTISVQRRSNPLGAYSTDRTVRADEAPDGSVALRGAATAVAGEPLHDPLEGQAVAWWRIEVGRSSTTRATGMNRRVVHEESHRVDFVLDDGSRQPARIDAASISGYVARPSGYGRGGPKTDATALTDEQRSLLAARSGQSDGRGLTANLYTVAIGEEVTVTGVLQRTTSGPVVTGRPDRKLIVTAFSHDEVVAEREQRARNGVGLVVVGLAMVVVGLSVISWWG